MGGGTGGSYSSPRGSLAANIARLTKRYPTDSKGRFGSPGRGQVRIVATNDPQGTAKELFEALSAGGSIKALANGKGRIATFADKSTVVYRPVSSSDGSPVLSIVLKGPQGVDYKIHFVDVKESK